MNFQRFLDWGKRSHPMVKVLIISLAVLSLWIIVGMVVAKNRLFYANLKPYLGANYSMLATLHKDVSKMKGLPEMSALFLVDFLSKGQPKKRHISLSTGESGRTRDLAMKSAASIQKKLDGSKNISDESLATDDTTRKEVIMQCLIEGIAVAMAEDKTSVDTLKKSQALFEKSASEIDSPEAYYLYQTARDSFAYNATVVVQQLVLKYPKDPLLKSVAAWVSPS